MGKSLKTVLSAQTARSILPNGEPASIGSGGHAAHGASGVVWLRIALQLNLGPTLPAVGHLLLSLSDRSVRPVRRERTDAQLDADAWSIRTKVQPW